MSRDDTDDAFSVLDRLRDLLVDLAGVRDSIDRNEPLRNGIDAKLLELEQGRVELEALYEDATQELP
jgi:hypothetical protein